MIKKIFFFLLTTTLSAIFINDSLAQNSNIQFVIYDSRPDLLQGVQILKDIEIFIQHSRLARLHRLISEFQSAHTLLTQKGLVNRESLQGIQRVVLVARYSESYFKLITSDLLEPQIKQLNQICEVLAKRHGFNEVQGSNIVEIMMKQMNTLVDQIISNSSENINLIRSLSKIKIAIGNAQAVSSQGDRPRAFNEANKAYRSIRDLMPILLSIQISDNSFDAARELLDLNELYANYAQIPGDTR